MAATAVVVAVVRQALTLTFATVCTTDESDTTDDNVNIVPRQNQHRFERMDVPAPSVPWLSNRAFAPAFPAVRRPGIVCFDRHWTAPL